MRIRSPPLHRNMFPSEEEQLKLYDNTGRKAVAHRSVTKGEEVLNGRLHSIYKAQKKELWEQREGLDSMRASLESGLRRTATLLGPHTPSLPSTADTSTLPPPPPLPSSALLRTELIRLSSELTVQFQPAMTTF
jgi:hypothetical protein